MNNSKEKSLVVECLVHQPTISRIMTEVISKRWKRIKFSRTKTNHSTSTWDLTTLCLLSKTLKSQPLTLSDGVLHGNAIFCQSLSRFGYLTLKISVFVCLFVLSLYSSHWFKAGGAQFGPLSLSLWWLKVPLVTIFCIAVFHFTVLFLSTQSIFLFFPPTAYLFSAQILSCWKNASALFVAVLQDLC